MFWFPLKVAVLLITLCVSLHATAQQWCPPGAKWWYEQWGTFGSQVGFVHVQYSSDTLVNGITAQKLEAEASGYDFIAQESYSQPLQPIITKSAGQAVSYWDGSQWILLFDLSIPPGGQWVLPMDDSNVMVTVQDTGRLEVSGQFLRFSIVEFTPSFGLSTDTIFEYIGYLKVFIDPKRTFIIDNDILGLRCYVDEVVVYSTHLTTECDYINVVSEEYIDDKISIWPNPCQEYVNLLLPENADYSFIIQDSWGREIHMRKQALSSSTIDVSSIVPGVYLITIKSSNGAVIGYRKLVKQ